MCFVDSDSFHTSIDGIKFPKALIGVAIQDLRGKQNSVNLDTNGHEVIEYDGTIHEGFEGRLEGDIENPFSD